MSHFSVLVIGPDPAAQLQPFHEFECTGTDDQYVQDIDVTDEVRAEYETASKTVYEVDGVEVERDALYRDPTPEEVREHNLNHAYGSMWSAAIHYRSTDWGDGRGYRAKVWDPKSFGATSREVPCVDCMTLAEYVEYSIGEQDIVGPGEEPNLEGSGKYGYVRVDAEGEVVQIVKRTNPNDRWDWWTIGGRWRGFFPAKPDGHKRDQLRVSQVDFDAARDNAEDEAVALFSRWERLVAEHGRAKSWGECLADHPGDIDAARDAYNSQPLVRVVKTDEGMGFRMGCWVTDLGYDREAYVTKQRNAALVPYAIVYKGKWTARGEPGWWVASSVDTVSEAEWCEQVARLYDDLPPDTLLTLVDCHV